MISLDEEQVQGFRYKLKNVFCSVEFVLFLFMLQNGIAIPLTTSYAQVARCNEMHYPYCEVNLALITYIYKYINCLFF